MRLKFGIYFIIVLLMAGCGETNGNAPKALQSTFTSLGFGCSVTFSSSKVDAEEEFTITLKPTGNFEGPPKQVGTAAGLTILTTTTEEDTVTMTAKAKFSFDFVARELDIRGRSTHCSKGLIVKEKAK